MISRSPAFARLQAWHLSNGLDFVFATYMCPVEPSAVEIAEAGKIVESLEILEGE